MNRKKMLIVSGGNIQDGFASAFLNREKRREDAPLLIAADRGLDHVLRLGEKPDHVIGDFDSVSEAGKAFLSSMAEERITRLKPEKDDSDTQSALRLAAGLGASEVTILGALGTRLDHVLANLGLLALGEKLGCHVTILDQYNLITLVPSGTALQGDELPGRNISFFPLGGPVEGLTLEGFRYPLNAYTLKSADAGLTVSNEIKKQTAVVTYDSGLLVMIISDDAGLEVSLVC